MICLPGGKREGSRESSGASDFLFPSRGHFCIRKGGIYRIKRVEISSIRRARSDEMISKQTFGTGKRGRHIFAKGASSKKISEKE